MKNGKLNQREMATLNSAWGILSRWADWAEEDAQKHGYEPDTDYAYNNAMYAVAGLCEFISEMEA